MQAKQRRARAGGLAQQKVVHVLPRAFEEYRGTKLFLCPSDPQFGELMRSTYPGFVHEPRTWAPEADHAAYLGALRAMEAALPHSLFQYDVVQPMKLGSRCSKTFVTRTLVGEPGITYKYLGLREFAHPWVDGSGSTAGAKTFATSIGAWPAHGLTNQLLADCQQTVLPSILRARKACLEATTVFVTEIN